MVRPTIEPATWEHKDWPPATALATIAVVGDAPHVWGNRLRAALQVRMRHSSQGSLGGRNMCIIKFHM